MTSPEHDPRLPAVYDAENRWADDDDFFLSVVNRRGRSRVLDLGCGTGRLTTAIAAAGHQATGIDPNRASLDAARGKPHGDRVAWVEGTAACLAPRSFDVAVMTSHVAQLFVTEEEWAPVLASVQRALVPGGTLAFDTRDPRARAWERWSRPVAEGDVELPDGRVVRCWTDVTSVVDDVVTFEWHNVFPDGDDVHGEGSLRFRSEHLVRSTVEAAGFRVEGLFGGWHGEPVDSGCGELVVVATTRRLTP